MTYCGSDCCKECGKFSECGGCEKCGGHPFGGSCIAERNENFGEVSKKNIKSIRKDGNKLYAASQDMKLYVLDFDTLDVVAVKRNVHKYMYYIAGITNHYIVTVSHQASEISVLDKETLETIRTIREPLRLSGPVKLEGGILYYASRNFNGIKMMKIE